MSNDNLPPGYDENRYLGDCRECEGTGMIIDEKGCEKPCRDCNGTGFVDNARFVDDEPEVP
jgi:DnaJ-class molecular chaperone